MRQRIIFAALAIAVVIAVSYFMFHDVQPEMQEFQLPDVYINGTQP